jgi:hypothetical protein
VKAAKSQQIVPNDRKHPNPVAIRAHRNGSESAALTASATAAEEHFTAVYKAVGCKTEDSRKNPYDAAASRLGLVKKKLSQFYHALQEL